MQLLNRTVFFLIGLLCLIAAVMLGDGVIEILNTKTRPSETQTTTLHASSDPADQLSALDGSLNRCLSNEVRQGRYYPYDQGKSARALLARCPLELKAWCNGYSQIAPVHDYYGVCDVFTLQAQKMAVSAIENVTLYSPLGDGADPYKTAQVAYKSCLDSHIKANDFENVDAVTPAQKLGLKCAPEAMAWLHSWNCDPNGMHRQDCFDQVRIAAADELFRLTGNGIYISLEAGTAP